MTAQPSISHHDHWEPVTGRGMHEFRDAYWGARGRAALKNVLARPPLERFLHVRQAVVQNLFLMDLPDGLFFVREEHRLLVERLRKAREAKTASEMQGCLLLGHPGIGKTYFLLFFLMQCLSREETILFTSSLGDTYLFDEDGVVRIRMADFSSCTHIPEDVPGPSQRVWSLVDCSPAKEPIVSSVTYGTRQLFFVAAARPISSRCGELKERFNVRKWWLPYWTEDELHALLASLPPRQLPLAQRGRYSLSNPDTTRSLIRDVGPCLRDILLYLTAPGQYEDLVNAALSQYISIDAIYHLLSGPGPSTNQGWDRIVLTSRAGPISPDAIDTDDRAVVRFKTRAIHNCVLAYLLALSAEDTEQLYATFRANARVALRRGGSGLFTTAYSETLLFENYAFHYVFSDEHLHHSPMWRHPFEPMNHQSTFPDTARRMTRAQTAAPMHFIYSGLTDVPDSQRTTVVLDAAGRVAWRLTREADGPLRGPASGWQWQESERHEPWLYVRLAAPAAGGRQFDSVAHFCAELQLQRKPDGRGLRGAVRVCASARDSLFDVYCLTVCRVITTIWAVRIATPRGDALGGGGRGFMEVAQLKGQLLTERPRRTVEVNYVVVVPYEDPGFAVEWSLPAEFEEHPGKVFIQFLDVRAFGGDVAQVLGVPRPDRDGDVDDGAAAAGTSGMATRGAKRRREEVE